MRQRTDDDDDDVMMGSYEDKALDRESWSAEALPCGRELVMMMMFT